MLKCFLRNNLMWRISQKKAKNLKLNTNTDGFLLKYRVQTIERQNEKMIHYEHKLISIIWKNKQEGLREKENIFNKIWESTTRFQQNLLACKFACWDFLAAAWSTYVMLRSGLVRSWDIWALEAILLGPVPHNYYLKHVLTLNNLSEIN